MTIPRPVRYRCELPGRLHVGGKAYPATVLELSERGAFIEEPSGLEEVALGSPGELELPLPGGEGWATGVTFTRFGTTRQELRHPLVHHLAISRAGFGVEFQPLPEAELERLRDFLELLDGR